jgi:serine/threonine protein kinase
MHMVMEYIDGHELFKEIVEQNVLSEARSAGIIQQVFSALQHCNQNRIIHRDVKPENIMIYRTQVKGGMGNKQAPMVKLIDFGLAIWYDHESVTETADDCLMACHYYLAPEAMRGNAMPASDVFSAGVVLHLMLAGHMPHRDVISGRQVLEGSSWAAISSSAKDLVCQALRSHPAERITAEEAAEHKWSHNIEVNYQPQDNNKTHVKVCNSLVRHDDVKPSALIAEISLLLKGSTWAFGEKNTDLIIDIMSSSVESRTKSFFDSAWVATEAWSRRVQ